MGFVVAWSYWVISWMSTVPVLALALSSFEQAVGDLGPDGRLLGAGLLSVVVILLNARGAVLSGMGEIILSAIKVIPMVAIPFCTLPYWRWDVLYLPSAYPALFSLCAAGGLTFWGFVGLEAGTTIASYVRHAEKTVPRALFCGTLLVLLIYIANTVSIMSVLSLDVIKSSANPYGDLLIFLSGPSWGPLIGQMLAWLVCIMCLGTFNSWMLAAGNVVMKASQEGLFPAKLGKINRHGSPFIGIALSTFCLFLCMIAMKNQGVHQQIQHLITLSTVLFIFIYMVVVLTLVYALMTKRIQFYGHASFILWVALCISALFCLFSLAMTDSSVIMGAFSIPFSGIIVGLLSRLSFFKKRQ